MTGDVNNIPTSFPLKSIHINDPLAESPFEEALYAGVPEVNQPSPVVCVATQPLVNNSSGV